MQRGHALPEVSFVIRLWLERDDVAGRHQWRFQARHVQSGDQTHCCSIAELVAFVERHAGVPGPRETAATDDDSQEVKT